MQVGELFIAEKLDLQYLREKLDGQSSYSDSALQFLEQKWDTEFDELSEKQANWAHKILDDLIEKRINEKRK